MLQPRRLLFVPVLGLWGLVVGQGCSTQEALPVGTTSPTPSADPAEAGNHGHQDGAHGGSIVSLGLDDYHAEAIFESGGKLRLFLLGSDETKVQEIDAGDLTAYVTPVGGDQSTAVTLRAQPQPGDREGTSSQFVAELPEALADRAVEVTIPSVRIGGQRYRIAFASAVEEHGDSMPDKVANAEERELYLTPGGAYTDADIEANGRTTASERFAAFTAKHDRHPQPGDKVCPITLTKANPTCTWIVGGKTYEFCCPPCVDEFVKLAKENPAAIKPPETYVK